MGANRTRLDKILPKLHGTKKLVLGNHDKFKIQWYSKYFTKIHGAVRYGNGMMLAHLPIHPQENNWFKLNAHGHIHHKDRVLKDPKYFNVGVDVVNPIWTPTPLRSLEERLRQNKTKLK